MTVSPELYAAYRHFRATRARPFAARERAREMVAHGNFCPRRPIPADLPTYPQAEAGQRYVEKPARIGLRPVGDVLPDMGRFGIWNDRAGKQGWFTTDECDSLNVMFGIVFQLPARRGVKRFLAGYTTSDECGCTIDFGTVYESADDVSNARNSEGAREAANGANELARIAAEHEREYHVAWQAGSRYADIGEEISEHRKTAMGLIRESRPARRQQGDIPCSTPLMAAAIAGTVRGLIASVRKAKKERAQLAAGSHRAFGFWPGSPSQRAAFNDGAGEVVV